MIDAKKMMREEMRKTIAERQIAYDGDMDKVNIFMSGVVAGMGKSYRLFGIVSADAMVDFADAVGEAGKEFKAERDAKNEQRNKTTI